MEKVLQEFRDYISSMPEGEDKIKLNIIYLKIADRYSLLMSDYQDIISALKSFNENSKEYFD